MGTLESEAKRLRRKGYVQQAVLATVGITGILALAMVAPNVLQLLPYITGDKYKFGYRARSAAGRLAKKGLVRFVRRKGLTYVEITPKGERLLTLEKEKLVLKRARAKAWDGRWRMVVFDIPERRRKTRERLRAIVSGLGFMRLQNSVWVLPYDCEEIVALIKADLQIGKDVLYVIVEKIENDSVIKGHFNLK